MPIMHCIRQFISSAVDEVTWTHLRWEWQWQVRSDTLSGTQTSESDVIKILCLANWQYIYWHFIHLYLYPGMNEVRFLEAVISQLKRWNLWRPSYSVMVLCSYQQELIEAKCIMCYWTRCITCKYMNQCSTVRFLCGNFMLMGTISKSP